MIEYDVETDGLQWPYHKAFICQFWDGVAPEGEILEPYNPRHRERIQWWFDRGADEGIRAWNSKFDFHFGLNAGFALPPATSWHDGMLVAHVIDERRSVALAAVSAKLLPEEMVQHQGEPKAWLIQERARRKKAASEAGTELVEPNFSDVPRDIMNPYALEDVYLTKAVGDIYDPMLEQAPDLKRVYEFEREVMAAIFDMERRGFPADPLGYGRLEAEVLANLDKIESQVEALASVGIEPEDLDDFEFNPKSSAQVLKALKRRGADLRFVTGESMDADNLDTVDDELAAAILTFRGEYKVLSTYVRPMTSRSYNTQLRAWKEPFIAPDGRVYANYRQVGARTGRMSCSDPNMQNQPRDDLRLRYNFVAEPGHKLVACDLSGVEMATFAYYTGNGRLRDAVISGADLHNMTADFVGLRERHRPGGIIESRRQRGKTFNFSVLYGAGIRSLRKAFRVDSDEARKMLQRYHDAYPEVRRLQNRLEARLYERSYVSSLAGRRFRCDDPRKEAYKFTNYISQGTAADILKRALIRLHQQGVPVVGLVHDEVIAHCEESDADEVQHLITQALIEHPEITEKVPLRADGGIYDRWSEVKDPSFKPAWAGS